MVSMARTVVSIVGFYNEGSDQNALSYNQPENYYRLDGMNGCLSGAQVCQIAATPTISFGDLPQLPAGFGTYVASYNSNGTETVSPITYTLYSPMVTVFFIVP